MTQKPESEPSRNVNSNLGETSASTKANVTSEGAESLFVRYVERMVGGEVIDLAKLREQHPSCGEQLVKQLLSFQELTKPPADLTSKTIGEYNVIRLLGRGGMGVVYEGWQKNLDRRVAIKVLPSGIAADARAIARFTQEAQLAAKVNHPNIVTVFGMGIEEDIPYFVMEYVEGQTLAQFLKKLRSEQIDRSIKNRSSKPPEALVSECPIARTSQGENDTLAQHAPDQLTHKSSDQHQSPNLEYFLHMARSFAGVADGLHHAHKHGVIHRDIKPANMMLEVVADEDGKEAKRLRLLDFGLARFEGQETLTRTGSLLGTLLYMSPEQAAVDGASRIDHRTDIYSLGISLYEAVTLKTPFSGKTQQETINQIINRDPQPPRKYNSRIPIDLETVILKCLHKDPHKRYENAGQLAADLRRLVHGDPVLARPQSTLEKIRRKAVRHRGKLLTALIISILATATAWFGWRSSNAELAIRRAEYMPKVEQACREMRKLTNLFAYDRIDHELSIYPWGKHVTDEHSSINIPTQTLIPVRKSEEMLTEAINACPDLSDAYWHRARVRLLMQQDVEALEDLTITTEIAPNHVPALFLKASVYRSQGENDMAQLAQQQAESVAGSETWAQHWLKGQRLAEQSYYSEAAKEFAHALDWIDSNGEPFIGARQEFRFLAAVCCRRGEQYWKALRHIAIVENEWPDSIQAQLIHGLVLFTLGGEPREHGKEVFDQVFRSSADQEAVATFILGHYAGILNRNESGIEKHDQEFFEKWLSRIEDPERKYWALSTISLFRANTGELEKDETVSHLVKALSHAPDIPEYYLRLAEIVGGKNGIALLREAKTKLPNDPHINSYLAFTLLWNAHYRYRNVPDVNEEAHECCRVAKKNLGPRDYRGRFRLARALVLLGEREDAIEEMEKVRHRDAWGWIQADRGQLWFDTAELSLSKAQKDLYRKDYDAAVGSLSQEQKGDYRKAIYELGISVKRWENARSFHRKIQAYMRLGDRDQLITEMNAAQSLFEKNNVSKRADYAVNWATQLKSWGLLEEAFLAAVHAYKANSNHTVANTILTELLENPETDLGERPRELATLLNDQLGREIEDSVRYVVLGRLLLVYDYLEEHESRRQTAQELVDIWETLEAEGNINQLAPARAREILKFD